MNQPLISIGMPAYNSAEYIGQAIDSILNQTYKNIELVISNNGSSDATGDICKGYSNVDKRVKYYEQSNNIGVAGNFQFVLDNSNGDFFMWAASDDWWSSDWVESLFEEMRDDDLGLFGFYAEGDKEISRTKNYGMNQQIKFFLDSDLSGKCYYSYALFKSSLIRKCNFEYVECERGADQIFLLHILRFGNLRHVPGGVFNYRLHDKSVSAAQRGARGVGKILLSKYPLSYYLMSIDAVAFPSKFLMPFLVVYKYFKEQLSVYIGLLRSIIRKIIN